MKPPASAFAQALRFVRRVRGLPQEDFDLVSSRTYVSSLERGVKQPTLPKVDALASVLRIHPLTLLLFCYAGVKGAREAHKLLARVQDEVDELLDIDAGTNNGQ